MKHWKQEFKAIKNQIEFNATCAKKYEEALWKIANLCGYRKKKCFGCPKDADIAALEMVAKLKRKLNDCH